MGGKKKLTDDDEVNALNYWLRLECMGTGK